jgi:hypothetical protein
MNSSPILKNELENLYLSGNSMSEIAVNLQCSIHKVVYWMSKYGIKRRSRSNALYVKLNPKGDPFKIKEIVGPEESFLQGLGLGIYWGEGERISKGKVRVANTNPNLIRVFRDFLTINCQVIPSRIHYYIICFNDSKPNEVLQYWSKVLEISEDKFGKIVQIAPQGKGTYRRKSQYGVCTIEVSNIKLKRWLMSELNKLDTLPK